MQLLAAGGGARAGGRGVYLAAHDGQAHSKTLIWKAANSTLDPSWRDRDDHDNNDDAASRTALDGDAVASSGTDGSIDCRTPLLQPLVYQDTQGHAARGGARGRHRRCR